MVNFKSEQGSAFLLTIIITVILLFVGSALGVLSMVERNQGQQEVYNLQAYYLARSGADAVAQGIIDNREVFDSLINNSKPSIELETIHFENGGTASIEVCVNCDELTVISTGTFKGSTHTVELTMKKSMQDFEFKEAVFAANEGSSSKPAIEMSGGAKIKGDVATNSEGEGSVKFFGGTKIDGNLQVGPDANAEDVVEVNNYGKGVVGEVTNLPSKIVYPAPVFPEFPEDLSDRGVFDTPTQRDYLIDEDGRYDIIHTSSNRKLQFDLKNGIRKIRVRKLVVGGPIELLNSEGGQLILYVDEEISRDGGNAYINYPGDPSLLTFYYAGESKFWDEQFRISASIVIKEAPVFLSHGVSVNGNIISGGNNIEISGGADVTKGLIYAPGAEIKITGGGATGAVVGKTFSASGGARVEYSKDAFKDSFVSELINPEFKASDNYTRGTWSARR